MIQNMKLVNIEYTISFLDNNVGMFKTQITTNVILIFPRIRFIKLSNILRDAEQYVPAKKFKKCYPKSM